MSDFPKNQTDQKLIKYTKETLREKKELSTPELAKEISRRTNALSESTAKSKLYTHIEQLEKNHGIKTEQRADGTPGNETRYWRLKQ